MVTYATGAEYVNLVSQILTTLHQDKTTQAAGHYLSIAEVVLQTLEALQQAQKATETK